MIQRYRLVKRLTPVYKFELVKNCSLEDYHHICGERLVETYEPTDSWFDLIRHVLYVERLYTKDEIDEKWMIKDG
jgi:hypothetical protein